MNALFFCTECFYNLQLNIFEDFASLCYLGEWGQNNNPHSWVHQGIREYISGNWY